MYYLGIDLGGTFIKCGLVDPEGEIVAKSSLPTRSERSYVEIIEDMSSLCRSVMAEAGIDTREVIGVGIGVPGCVNREGFVLFADNIRWRNVNLIEEFRRFLDINVYVSNDANCAALGEMYFGNAKGKQNVVFVTLGTGVGGGVIIDGKLFDGVGGIGTELGHILISRGGELCGCGRRGCWEAYASVSALIRQTKAAIEAHPDTAMNDGTPVTGRTSFDWAKRGDVVAKEVVETYLSYVAEGIVDIVNIFRPDEVVIGGAISKEGEYLLNPIRSIVARDTCGGESMMNTAIDVAGLRNDAGILGAAALVMNK